MRKSPLHQAYRHNKPDAFGLLLEYGAELYNYNTFDLSVFDRIVMDGNAEFCKIVLESEAKVNVQDALRYAGSIEVFKLLLESGAKIDALDNQGHSILFHHAYHQHKTKTTRYLIQLGETFNAKDLDISNQCADIMRYPEYVTAFAKLNRDKLNDRFPDGTTQFDKINYLCPDECLEILLKAGLDPNLATHGVPPLHHFTEHRELGKMKLLLDYGANINAQDRYGDTPLIAAYHHYFAEGVELLLKRGANVHVRNKKGESVLKPRHPFRRANELIATAKINPCNCCVC